MRPKITKLGTIDCDLVETTPVVFQDKLYRYEYVRKNYAKNTTGDSYSRFVDHDTGHPTPPFAHGYHFASAFVDGATVYVTATNGWGGDRVDVFASEDLENWRSWPALALPRHTFFNTSVCRADGRYVLMYEIGAPIEIAGWGFAARFAESADMKHWEPTPVECVYSKDRYTAPHCLRFLDGWFYNFYLEAHRGFEQRVVRSKDLIHWEASHLNPVLWATDDDRQIANPALTEAERQRIATAVNINNSDIDFCEYQGRLIINYSWGDQQGVEHLGEAVYEGTERQFLEAWYPPN